jgi:hypothetical protein
MRIMSYRNGNQEEKEKERIVTDDARDITTRQVACRKRGSR